MKKFAVVARSIALISFIHVGWAQGLTLPDWVSEGMVFPANRAVSLRGTAAPGADVAVTFAGKRATAQADGSGAWSLTLDPVIGGAASRELVVAAKRNSAEEIKKIADVAVGDIWLCAGQSNMAFMVAKAAEAAEASADIKGVDVRYFDGKTWARLTPSNVGKVSAVAVYFATELAKRQKKPVGIFVAARGGTGIEAWLPVEAFPDTETGARMRSLARDPAVLKADREDAADFRPFGKHRLSRWKLGRAAPASLYEKWILPAADLPIRGALWYQGETNIDSLEYDLWLSHLIGAYRTQWNAPRLPFVVVQLPCFDPGTPEGRAGWARIQAAQASVAQKTPFVEMADIRDLGDMRDIHPRRKKEAGERSAQAACKLLKSEQP